MAVRERCVAHPSRPAVDRCPVCDRPRCGADAAFESRGCAICHGGLGASAPAQASERELLVRAALAANALALLAGVVLQEYPGAPVFQYLAPAMAGAAVGAVATAAAGEPRGLLLTRVRVLATGYAVLASGLGFMLDGTYGVLDPSVSVLVPYLMAGAGAWLWTRPPRAKRASSPG